MSLLSSFVTSTFSSLLTFSVAARHAEAKAKLDVFRKKRALLKLPLHEVPAVPYQTLRGKTCVVDAVVNCLRAVAPPQEVALLLSDEAIAYAMVLTIIQVVTCDFKSETTRMQRVAGVFAGICPADAAPHAMGVRLLAFYALFSSSSYSAFALF